MKSGRVSPRWLLVAFTIQGIAFLYQWPTLLALVSRVTPPRLKSTLMGAAFLSLFISNSVIGRLGGFYEAMTPSAFWLMHAAIAVAGGLLIMTLRRVLKPALEG